jgi:type IV secretion system protein VirB4
MEWLDMLLGLGGLQTTAAQRNELARAVLNMHQTGSRTLTDLVLTLQDAQMRAVLEQYTVRGSMGHLLDADEDGLGLSDFTVFEVEELMSLGDRFALPVLWYLFRRIERSLDGRPAAIVLDEAWLMLGHPVFREKLRQWLKVLRKQNCLVLMATQSLSDAARSEILDVLVESCPTKIFLPNPSAREPSATALYEGMGLNARQIDILASAIPKKHYYYVSPRGRRLYELALGPLALALCGASSKEEVAKITELQAQWGDRWVDHWLAARQLPISLGEAA